MALISLLFPLAESTSLRKDIETIQTSMKGKDEQIDHLIEQHSLLKEQYESANTQCETLTLSLNSSEQIVNRQLEQITQLTQQVSYMSVFSVVML